tara:strand:+ start:904 stop:1260 length:357 start_codon:yes stop_codon:yes gene_type:complete
MSKEILKYGLLHYLQKIDKNVSEQRYEPVSYEYWKRLRELEPTKLGNDYDFYTKLKKEQYESEIERRKNCEFELHSKHYSLHPSDIDKTKQSIRDIQSNELFETWYNSEDVIESILNY